MASFVGVDNFESYTAGNAINGGSGGSGWGANNWTTVSQGGTASATVSNAKSYDGTQSVKLAGDATHYVYTYRQFAAASVGDLFSAINVQTFGVADYAAFELFDASAVSAVYFAMASRSGVKALYLYNSGSYIQVGPILTENTWYVVNLQWDNANQANKVRLRVFVTGTGWSAWSSWVVSVANFASLAYHEFYVPNSATVTSAYFDTVQPTDPTVSARSFFFSR